MNPNMPVVNNTTANSVYYGTAAQLVSESFVSQVYQPGVMDVQSEPIYDTLTYAAAANITQSAALWFTSIGPAANKTIADTNMVESNKLRAPEAFSIFSFRIWWSSDVLLADIVSILNNFAYVFTLGTKAYQTGPIWQYNAGAGLSINNDTATTGTGYFSTNGMPGRHAMHVLALRLPIENQCSFFAQLQGNTVTLTAGGGTGGKGFRTMNLLDGLHARGIQ